MNGIDLILEPSDAAGPLHVALNGPLGSEVFTVTVPVELMRLQQIWRKHFIAHHDPAGPDVPADRVREHSASLCEALHNWLRQGEWVPLQRALAHNPTLPLRLRCRQRESRVDQLPWEALPFGRPIWRLPSAPALPSHSGSQVMARRPRVLLLVGEDRGLKLNTELVRIQELRQRGGLELISLQGNQWNLATLAGQLHDPDGWDVLVFLGHSSSDSRTGGRLQLGDGSWLSGLELQRLLSDRPARNRVPRLVLLNSCSGPDLADCLVAAGVHWVVCFRDPIPNPAASLSFCLLLDKLQQGVTLTEGVRSARQHLAAHGPAGCQLLLSVVGADTAKPLELPLSRWRQLQRRLAGSSRSQAIAAAVLAGVAFLMELMPTEALPSALLDRRLAAQREWRQLHPGQTPNGKPLPVLLLNNRNSPAALRVAPATSRVSRALLTAVLGQIPPEHVPMVGLDLALDEVNPDNSRETERLARIVRLQQRPMVVAGWFGPETCVTGGGSSSRPLQQLLAAGVRARDMATGTRALDCATGGGGAGLRPRPLQLVGSVSADNFAGFLAQQLNPAAAPLPEDAVIDWSVNWDQLVRVVEITKLSELKTPLLVVGSDGTVDPNEPDQFEAPTAVAETLSQSWELNRYALPGALLQAVLIQSMVLQHWLQPASLSATTVLATGLGVLVAAALPRRRQRLLLLSGVAVTAVPLALQIAVVTPVLIPLSVPGLGLATTALLRREHD